ncbi:Replication E1 [Gossypium arboreum]|uniref:Replication E1 n=1 Tax=Gossypium arboreum TaxID=29729 RepID=A0A0B0P1X8_GOSAR|nr:Replication E1 [Gossypium arboreum]
MSGTWHQPRYVSQCKTMSRTWHRATKLASGIKGCRRHRSHNHLKLLVAASKGGKKA